MFGTSGIRGPVGTEVTAATALSVGRALVATGHDRVVIGRDPRDSGSMLRDALTAGVTESGGTALDLGQAATPTVARSVAWQTADAGVAITASHNPPPDNGLKLWTPSGQAFTAAQRAAITDCIEQDDYALAAWNNQGETRTVHDAAATHRAAITDAINQPVQCSVIVDIGNGAGGITAAVLRDLGCSVETLNADPDGAFPARPSEPTAESLTTLRTTVAETDAALGVAHDGDADRMVAVDETGAYVSGDVLLALFAKAVVEPGDRVAAPVDTSLCVDDAVAECGATVNRTKVGDVYVAERTTETDVVFGGEPSGAWIWPDETLCPDGPLAAAKLAAEVASNGSLSTQVAAIDTYPIRRESIQTDSKTALMDAVEARLTARYEASAIDTLDGVRVATDDGWLLVRASGTQPLVRLTAEARKPDRADALMSETLAIVSTAMDE